MKQGNKYIKNRWLILVLVTLPEQFPVFGPDTSQQNQAPSSTPLSIENAWKLSAVVRYEQVLESTSSCKLCVTWEMLPPLLAVQEVFFLKC